MNEVESAVGFARLRSDMLRRGMAPNTHRLNAVGRRTGEVPHVAEQQVPAGHAPAAEEDRPDQGVAQEARLGPRLLRVGREPPAAPPAARAWAGRSAELGWGRGCWGAHSL